jgi:hypothetical protein
MSKRTGWLIGGGVVALGIGLGVAFWRGGAGLANNATIGSGSGPGVNVQGESAIGVLSLLDLPSDAVVLALVRVADTDALGLTGNEREALRADAQAWVGASFSPTHASMEQLMRGFGVVPIPSWAADPAFAVESWQSSLSNIRDIDFAPEQVAFGRVAIDSPSPFPDRGIVRCSRRDGARSFLQSRWAEPKRDAFLSMGGRIRGSGEQVTVTYRFAWNPEVGRWILVQICLYDFPNDRSVSSMVL